MRKIILICLVLSLILIAGCMNNAAVGSVVRTKEIKNMRLNNCLQICEDMSQDNINDCRDLCYAEIADSFEDKTLCRNILNKELRTVCLIY